MLGPLRGGEVPGWLSDPDCRCPFPSVSLLCLFFFFLFFSLTTRRENILSVDPLLTKLDPWLAKPTESTKLKDGRRTDVLFQHYSETMTSAAAMIANPSNPASPHRAVHSRGGMGGLDANRARNWLKSLNGCRVLSQSRSSQLLLTSHHQPSGSGRNFSLLLCVFVCCCGAWTPRPTPHQQGGLFFMGSRGKQSPNEKHSFLLSNPPDEGRGGISRGKPLASGQGSPHCLRPPPWLAVVSTR